MVQRGVNSSDGDEEAERFKSSFISLRVKVVGSLLVLLGVVTGGLSYLAYVRGADALTERITTEITQITSNAVLRVEGLTAGLGDDVRSLAQAPSTTSMIDSIASGGVDPDSGASAAYWRLKTEELFSVVARNHPTYAQIRYINARGREAVRVDSRAGDARIVPRDELQDKSSTHYFQSGMQLGEGEIDISPMTLNRENGQVEIPYRPMIRAVTPVFDNLGRRRGIVVVNQAPRQILAQFSVPIGEYYLLNAEGYYLRHPDSAKEFGFDLGLDEKIDDLRPGLAAEIAAASDDVATLDMTAPDGTRRILAYKKTHYNPASADDYWTVAINVPRMQIIAPAVRLRDDLVLIGLLILLVASGFGVFLANRMTSRIVALSNTAKRISAGDYAAEAPVRGHDEIGHLAHSFNVMTRTLRLTLSAEAAGRKRVEQLLETVRETANALGSTAGQILAGTAEQSSGAHEQAAAVAETVTSVDEVRQTAEQAAERSKAVARSAQKASEVGERGRQAIDRSVDSMGTVKHQTEAIAESILSLVERAQAIGEIIATVDDIADQTNLLALNAGIEASRAGEHGAGFTVVAREIKALAEQSRESTTQIRQILGDIQRATNSAVLATEEGSKSVNSTLEAVNRAGETIYHLAETIREAAQASSQISASAGQQAAGMAQVQQAMHDIDSATNQTLAATRQAERAARELNDLGMRLKELLAD